MAAFRQRHSVSGWSRRAVLRLSVSGAATTATAAVLAACGNDAPAASPTTVPAPTTAPTAATAAPTAPAMFPPTATRAAGATVANTAAPTADATTAPVASAMPVASAAARPTTALTVAAAAGTMTADGKLPSPDPQAGVPDAFTKLPSPFKSVATVPGRGGKVSTFMISYVPPPTPHDGNAYWKDLEKRLGVASWDVTLAPASDYPQKFATMIASGNLPDLIWYSPLNYPDQYKTVLQGAFTDLTPYLTGAGLAEYPNLAKFAPVLWRNAALNKKVYGVPRPRFLANNTMHFRQDWAEKLGYGAVKNANEATKMFVAMSKGDPDGNGAADTFGLSCNSPNPQLDVDVFAQMHRAPNGWRLGGDGTLTHTWETPEHRSALELARQMYAGGAYHPDALMQMPTQNQALLFAGKIGGFSGGIQSLMGSTGFRGKARQFNPKAVISSWLYPGADGGKPAYHRSIGYFGLVGIPATVGKDRERVKELLRIVDYLAAPFGSEEWLFATYGLEGTHYMMKDGAPVVTDAGKNDIGDALTGLMNAPPVAFYDTPGDAADMQKIQASLLANAVDDPTWGYYSPTSASRQAVLQQLQSDRLVAIVTGREPVSVWDDFLKDWRSRGGDMIRKEYQDALKG